MVCLDASLWLPILGEDEDDPFFQSVSGVTVTSVEITIWYGYGYTHKPYDSCI